MACVHLNRECPEARLLLRTEEPGLEMVKRGALLLWLDVAATIDQYGSSLDWTAVGERARAWGAEADLACGVLGAATLLGVDAPESILAWAGAEATREAPALLQAEWVKRLGRREDFTGLFVRIGLPYLLPSRDAFESKSRMGLWAKRAIHFLKASVALGVGAVEGVVCNAALSVRRSKKSLALLLALLSAGSTMAHDYGDDYGDEPDVAASMAVGGAAVNGKIEVDTDADWFVFHAPPQVAYRIAVTNGTLWDATLELRGPDRVSVFARTNSAGGGFPSSVNWTNTGAACLCYVKVGGYAEFTTGTYQVAVSRVNYADTDSDGLPDNWEMAQFGTLTNAPSGDRDGDGFSNEQEYNMGTGAADSHSSLSVSIAIRTNWAECLWPASSNGTYRLWVSTNLLQGSNWTVLGTVIQSTSNHYGLLSDPGVTNWGQRYYRVGIVY